MIQYECFTEGRRRSELMTDETAVQILGGRTMAGWEAVHRWVQGPSGSCSVVTMTGVGGRVWCMFVGEILS